MKRATLLAALSVCGVTTLASGQVIDSQDFEAGSGWGSWLVNGNQEIFFGGNPGQYMGVPFMDFWGVSLRNENPATPMVGDLTVHPSFTVTVDFRVLQLRNFFDEDMDPANFDLTLEFVDYGDQMASVYMTGPVLPSVAEGWKRFTWTVPNTGATALPAGWGGTGDEDPVTFEPRLPANRTFASVLANVDEIRITTMKPGYFYSSSFWEAGFDNLHVTVGTGGPACGTSDFNGDNDFGTDADIEAFFACLGGSCCATCWAGGSDFNGDGDFGTDQDIESFFRVLAGGNC